MFSVGTSERRARERAARREKILSAARELFVQKGFHAVTLRTVADAVEYSPAALYSYFPDKEALIFALVREDFEAFSAQFPALLRIVDPVERLVEIGNTYIRFAAEYPNHYRLMFMSAHLRSIEERPEKYEHHGEPARDAYAFLRLTVQQAMSVGRFRPDFQDAELVCQALWACVHGVAALEITHRSDPWVNWRPLESRVRAVTDALIAGMTRAPMADATA